MNVAVYEWLSREFKPIDDKLDAEGKTELDGIVWKISNEWVFQDFTVGIKAAIEKLESEKERLSTLSLRAYDEHDRPLADDYHQQALELDRYLDPLRSLLVFTKEEWEKVVKA